MSRALVVIADQPASRGSSGPRVQNGNGAATVIDAQVAGQSGARRGLRGGAPVLDAARAAYLDAEWRGADDRRLPAGILRKVSI